MMGREGDYVLSACVERNGSFVGCVESSGTDCGASVRPEGVSLLDVLLCFDGGTTAVAALAVAFGVSLDSTVGGAFWLGVDMFSIGSTVVVAGASGAEEGHLCWGDPLMLTLKKIGTGDRCVRNV